MESCKKLSVGESKVLEDDMKNVGNQLEMEKIVETGPALEIITID